MAVKDAKGDVAGTLGGAGPHRAGVLLRHDMLNLPWLSLGAGGFVSVLGHVVGDRLHEMIDAFEAGQVGRALASSTGDLLPGVHRPVPQPGRGHDQSGANLLGLPGGPVRLPLADATDAEIQPAARGPRGRG